MSPDEVRVRVKSPLHCHLLFLLDGYAPCVAAPVGCPSTCCSGLTALPSFTLTSAVSIFPRWFVGVLGKHARAASMVARKVVLVLPIASFRVLGSGSLVLQPHCFPPVWRALFVRGWLCSSLMMLMCITAFRCRMRSLCRGCLPGVPPCLCGIMGRIPHVFFKLCWSPRG